MLFSISALDLTGNSSPRENRAFIGGCGRLDQFPVCKTHNARQGAQQRSLRLKLKLKRRHWGGFFA
jgi:hypothetical protein